MSRKPPVRSVLIANRGEIAVRLIRSLRALGLRTVVVYSEADERSLAVQLADEASPVGPPPPAESYLRIDVLLEVARRHGVDAVHPGYGFLSERQEFARAVEDAGLIFLGPTPQQIALLGDKLEARKLVEEVGIGPVPGSREPLSRPEEARKIARDIGFPMILKAAAGGGGKGIRVVRDESELETSFRLAASEASSSFGSPLLFAERYLEGARHVEIQVLGDGRGGARLFPERDCSLQRRLQKVIEESPSPAVSAAMRVKLLGAALSLVQRTRYRGPGTLEFLLTPEGHLHFLEMNTRIQVEHPVSEMISGIDLVAEQVRVARGARFPGRRVEESLVDARGAAIELRINAEDPLNDFRPSVGTVDAVSFPGGPGIRVDSALLPGTEITPYYDPLIAKIIAWGENRKQALARLRAALAELVVVGVSTNLPVGHAMLEDPGFQDGRYHCQTLVEKLRDTSLLKAHPREGDLPTLAAALAFLYHGRRMAEQRPCRRGVRHSAWRRQAGRRGGAVTSWELEGS